MSEGAQKPKPFGRKQKLVVAIAAPVLIVSIVWLFMVTPFDDHAAAVLVFKEWGGFVALFGAAVFAALGAIPAIAQVAGRSFEP